MPEHAMTFFTHGIFLIAFVKQTLKLIWFFIKIGEILPLYGNKDVLLFELMYMCMVLPVGICYSHAH